MKKISELTGDMEFPGLKNLFRIMKLTAFLILVSVVCVFANETYSQTKKINLDMKNVTVKEVLSGIEEQSEFHFMYSPKVIDANREVVIDAENAKIEEVLKSLFAGTDVEYTIKDRIIVLSTSAVINDLFNNQQQKSVTGKVTDSSGGSLPGVSVVVKGTTTGVITDNSGNYKIGIPDNATLQFSFVGMKTQEIAIGGKSTINVTMADETIGIEEVVAVGYGTQKKSDITGSVSSVSKKDLGDRQVSSIAALIQGKAAGVDVTQGKMRIRGVTSFNNTDPLVVIDGFIGGNLSTVNPNDIENIEVLKDASSTAIYGSRGAKGLFL